MTYRAVVYEVMIASPSDVSDERAVVREVLAAWNDANAISRAMVLLPVGWESHSSPAAGGHPQQVINKQLLQRCDLLVAIFWTRFGTPRNGYESGTAEEIEKHTEAGKPAMLYFSQQHVRPGYDATEYARLQQFKEKWRTRCLFAEYETVENFRSAFSHHIQISSNQELPFGIREQNSGTGAVAREPEASNAAVSLGPKASDILRALAVGDSDGAVSILHFAGGHLVRAGDETVFSGGDAREYASWRAAIDELRNVGALSTEGTERWRLTESGYKLADSLQGH